MVRGIHFHHWRIPDRPQKLTIGGFRISCRSAESTCPDRAGIKKSCQENRPSDNFLKKVVRRTVPLTTFQKGPAMILNTIFHTDANNHDHIPFSSAGFPYACIYTDMDVYADRCVSWHWHTSMEIVIIVKGIIELRTPDLEIVLRAGDAAFINTGVLHAYQVPGTEHTVMYAHLFHMDFLSGADGSIFEEKYFLPVTRCTAFQAWLIHPDTLDRMKMTSSMLHVVELMKEEPEGFELDVRSELCSFWKGLLKETQEFRKTAPAGNVADAGRIKLMMDYVRDHFAEQVSVEDIAASAGVSTRECTRCFRRCIGVSPIEHLNQYRVRMAAKGLRETAGTVIEISESCGFSSPSYFSKVFRDLTGMTPKEYQKSHRLAEK